MFYCSLALSQYYKALTGTFELSTSQQSAKQVLMSSGPPSSSTVAFDMAGISDFLKIYVPLLACGVLVSSLGTGADWTLFLWDPRTVLDFVFQLTLAYTVSSFVIGSCVWAFLFLMNNGTAADTGYLPDARYLSSILWTLVALVVSVGVGTLW